MIENQFFQNHLIACRQVLAFSRVLVKGRPSKSVNRIGLVYMILFAMYFLYLRMLSVLGVVNMTINPSSHDY
jgi:hypothetical protein